MSSFVVFYFFISCSIYLSSFFVLLLLLLLFEFFIPALVDSFSLDFEWQQVSSSLQESFQYSCWYQQFRSLDGFHSSSYFHVLHIIIIIII